MPRPTRRVTLTMGPSKPPEGVQRLAEHVRDMQELATRNGGEMKISVTMPDGFVATDNPERAFVKSLEDSGRELGCDTEVVVKFSDDSSPRD